MTKHTQTPQQSQWQRIKPILATALELPVEQQPAFLQQQNLSAEDLKELQELIAAYQVANSIPPATSPSSDSPPNTAAHTQSPWTGRVLGPGHYRCGRLIGQGGMGWVHEAQRIDGNFKQQVAIKFMREGLIDKKAQQRFEAERQTLAELNHPHLAQVFDGGLIDETTPYMVMELVVGQSIDKHCEEYNLNITEKINLIITLCDVVQYAHTQGVIHRDLKPDNVLVTPQGILKLVDFGIAKHFTEQAHTTRAEQRMTPEFASPEQIRGEPLTPASDIYSLGMIIYTILTHGKTPYLLTTNALSLLNAICEKPPLPPSYLLTGDHKKQVKGNLDAIVAQALEKLPNQRYASALHLSTDLRRHLENKPVYARRGLTAKIRLWWYIYQHKIKLIGSALVLGIVSAYSIFWWAENKLPIMLEGFEIPALPLDKNLEGSVGAMNHPPSPTWKFTGHTGSGIQRNGSSVYGHQWDAQSAPEGVQTAYLTGNAARISTTVFLNPGYYKVSFYAARRLYRQDKPNSIQVRVGGENIGSAIPPIDTLFQKYITDEFQITKGANYTLELASTSSEYNGECTTFVDRVSIDDSSAASIPQ
jgi:serine/threonine protein kinase